MSVQPRPSSLLEAQAAIPLADPSGLLVKLCDMFAERGVVTVADGTATIASPLGQVELTVDGDNLLARAMCADETKLAMTKGVLAERVFALAGEEKPVFSWTGHRADSSDLPHLREMTVRGATQVTPRMRRVVLAGDAAHFAQGGLHVRILVPPRGRAPVHPRAGADGRIIWPTGEDVLAPRVYTVRSIDTARGEIAIDMVLHEGSAPGSDWAVNAAPGDRVGLLGPTGAWLAPADRYLIAGDETALPAIARMLEVLPAGAEAVVRIEVADAAEEQPLPTAATIDLAWLHRGDAAAGTTDLLERAVRAIPWPDAATRVYVWAAAEQAAARGLRAYLGQERGLPPAQRYVGAYWRRGHDGES
ncbi:siderophore-interacting protein [Chelatococcus reniformis]|uniref:NADPH-dependent ferric siderophore reductase n=1 Tax=Chelatococcus reniformis TaxID=1494448 RepID=A0A916UPN3_9HYPH|nr:siderophore-interacting protein [Chelatococcus reniformis]GGC82106.1 NADPH-dependent ferric siderophore reductase [Chelatococcus reniformis]